MSVEEFLNLTDADIQHLVAANCGESVLNPFTGSAVDSNSKEKVYDFDYLPDDEKEDDEIDLNNLDYLED